MTNFDYLVGAGSYEMEFGGYRIEVTSNTTFGDMIDEMKEMAKFLVENNQRGAHIIRFAEYFGIPREYAVEVYNETKTEYRMYA